MSKTLLPAGCYDLLPPQARQESALSHMLLTVFESFGYEQVSPPLLEYSESLLAGRGAVLSPQIFRVMDPGAHKVMGLRADITLQIARIASSRLSSSPRPLRLCYNGLILRMQGEQFKGARQLRQAGIELIGAASPEADAEVILVAATSLRNAGIGTFTIDLNLPGIVPALLVSEKFDNDTLQKLLSAVAHKDVSSIRALSFAYRDSLVAMMECAGSAKTALATMERLELPDSALAQIHALKEVIAILEASGNPEWTLTVDATEGRGLAYHSGISFSIFVPGVACEVGRGGRYRIEGEKNTADLQATGFTLYVDTLRDLLPAPASAKRVFVSEGIACKDTKTLREQGYVVIFALNECGTGEDDARTLNCTHYYKNGQIKTL